MPPIIRSRLSIGVFLTQLDDLFQRELPSRESGLLNAAKYHFRNPGKGFRAQLALASGEALRLHYHDVLIWAAACELIHNASLVHDDISDASTHRRGQKSIHEHFGIDTALCLGDWMVAKAFELASKNKTHGGQLVGQLATAMQQTCAGQASDVGQKRCITINQWKRIAAGKTSPFLLAPIAGVALASNFGYSLEGLKNLVSLCGLVYQGRNDIDDIVPSSHRSCDLDGRKPNLVVSLFHEDNIGNEDFIRWYNSGDTSKVGQWQQRIASSQAIVRANHALDIWLAEAELIVPSVPSPLREVATQLVASVNDKKITETQRGRIA
ncbi:MAG: serralysin [Porticoccaceae bacterium]|nr:serralysin [Porticoccaceae bacterium]